MLTGQAKTDYQREYMRRSRAKNKDSALLSQKQGLENARGLLRMDELASVRPKAPTVRPVRPEVESVRPTQEEIGTASKPGSKRYTGPLTKDRQTSKKGFNQ